MSRPAFWLLPILFFADVRVRADHPESGDCWGKTVPCAIQSAHQRRELKLGEAFTLVLAKGSLAEQGDEKSVRLVEGQFYIEVSKPVEFKTPYAVFSCAGECKALVERKLSEVNVKALAGTWKLSRMGEKKVYELGAGLQLTVGEVEDSGQARMDFPQSLPWASTLLAWARLYPGKAEAFKSEAAQFRSDWKEAVESASVAHAEAAQRTIASFEAGLAQERARRKAELNEEAELRALFRKKNDIDP